MMQSNYALTSVHYQPNTDQSQQHPSSSSSSSSSQAPSSSATANNSYGNRSEFEFGQQNPHQSAQQQQQQQQPPTTANAQPVNRRTLNSTQYQLSCLKRYRLDLDQLEPEAREAQLREVGLAIRRSQPGQQPSQPLQPLPCPRQYNPVARFTDKGAIRFRFYLRYDQDHESFDENAEMDKLSNQVYQMIYELDQKLMAQNGGAHLVFAASSAAQSVDYNDNELDHLFGNQGTAMPTWKANPTTAATAAATSRKTKAAAAISSDAFGVHHTGAAETGFQTNVISGTTVNIAYNCTFPNCDGYQSQMKQHVMAHVQTDHFGDRVTVSQEQLEQCVQMVELPTQVPAALFLQMMMVNQQHQQQQEGGGGQQVTFAQTGGVKATGAQSSRTNKRGGKASTATKTMIPFQIAHDPTAQFHHNSLVPHQYHHPTVIAQSVPATKGSKGSKSKSSQVAVSMALMPTLHLQASAASQQQPQAEATTPSGKKSKRKSTVPNYRFLNHYYTKSVNSRGRTEYQCTIGGCTKRVISDWPKFRLHQHIHLNVRPYSCAFPGCEANFTSAQRTHVLRHLLLRHLHHLNTNKLSAPAIQKYVRANEEFLNW